MNNKVLFQAIALDLKRVAVGMQSGSSSMTKRFVQEVLMRKKSINSATLNIKMNNLLAAMETALHDTTSPRIGDDALMYSALLMNYSQMV